MYVVYNVFFHRWLIFIHKVHFHFSKPNGRVLPMYLLTKTHRSLIQFDPELNV